MGEQSERDESWRGEVGKLTDAALADFLAEGVIGRLGCLDADGWPYVVPVWFDYADGGFYLVPRARAVWAEHLARDDRAALTIDEAGRQRKVIVQGRAALIERPNVGGAWGPVANRMATRYLGPHGPDYLIPTLNEPRWLFHLRPSVMKTWQGNDWAARYKYTTWGTTGETEARAGVDR